MLILKVLNPFAPRLLHTQLPLASFWCLYCKLWTYFIPCSSVFIVNFEQVNAGWVSIYACFDPFHVTDLFPFSLKTSDHWSLYTAWKHQKTTGHFLYPLKSSKNLWFLSIPAENIEKTPSFLFSRGIGWDQWHEMG